MLVPQTSGKRALGRGAAGAKDLGHDPSTSEKRRKSPVTTHCEHASLQLGPRPRQGREGFMEGVT